MDSANGHPFAASLYALRSSQLRIQLKARNKSVRMQARLTKSQNTSLSLQSRPFGGCELLQNVYLCISTYNIKVIFTCITASNKTFVQIKNAKQKSPITMMGLFFRIILVAVLEH